jgi:cysteine desulfurase / selenocysteine lyase
MPTTTPIDEGFGGQALPGSTPNGLPDVATLTRWANQFFGSAPGVEDGARDVSSKVPAAAPPTGIASATIPAASIPAAAPAPAGVATRNFPLPELFPSLAALSDAILPRLQGSDLTYPNVPAAPALFGAIPSAAAAPAGFNAIPSAAAASNSSPSFYFLETAQVPDVPAGAHPAFDVRSIRRDFPILATRVNGRPLVWFDNGATTQKPLAVIERLSYFYRNENSNIHRAAHELAARATDAYEGSRRQIQRFLGASAPEEIVFVRGATEAINLVAQSWGRANVGKGDDIIISHLEHHANIVPWQHLAIERGANLKVIPVDSTGQIDLFQFQRLLSDRTKIVSITHVSNALGTITPVKEVVELAHRAGAVALVDGAQSVPHTPIDVQALGADFFVLSGHKLFGPTGIGVLYGRQSVLEAMPPWQGGGNMIEDVTFEKTRYQRPPWRFEAGTGNIADAVGLGAAVEYLNTIGMANIERYEHGLLEYATKRLLTIPRLQLIGTATNKASVLSFVIEGLEPTAIGSALNEEGIAVRAGHHCAQPILRRFGHESTVRATLAFYNTCEEIDTFIATLRSLVASSVRSQR